MNGQPIRSYGHANDRRDVDIVKALTEVCRVRLAKIQARRLLGSLAFDSCSTTPFSPILITFQNTETGDSYSFDEGGNSSGLPFVQVMASSLMAKCYYCGGRMADTLECEHIDYIINLQ